MRVGGEVHAPVPISKVDINFETCIKQKEQIGFQIIDTIIDETGRIRSLRFLKPVPPCAESVIRKTLKRWRFKPGTYRGKPVAVWYTLTVNLEYR